MPGGGASARSFPSLRLGSGEVDTELDNAKRYGFTHSFDPVRYPAQRDDCVYYLIRERGGSLLVQRKCLSFLDYKKIGL